MKPATSLSRDEETDIGITSAGKWEVLLILSLHSPSSAGALSRLLEKRSFILVNRGTESVILATGRFHASSQSALWESARIARQASRNLLASCSLGARFCPVSRALVATSAIDTDCLHLAT